MSDKIRNCPLCGETPESDAGTYTCKNIACYLWGHRIPSRIWNARPVEYRLEADNKRLLDVLSRAYMADIYECAEIIENEMKDKKVGE